MKLKKVLSLGLALAMAASLAACGSGNPAPSDTSGAAGGGQTEKAADAAGGEAPAEACFTAMAALLSFLRPHG